MAHKKHCECEICKTGIDAFQKKQKESIDKYGWVAHYVSNDPTTPYEMNIHTHGLAEKFNHKDLQICLLLNQNTAHFILANIVDRIKKGEVFEAGKEYDNIIKKYSVIFAEAEECERPVLRIIFPNPDGSFNGGIAEGQMIGTKQIKPVLPKFKLN